MSEDFPDTGRRITIAESFERKWDQAAHARERRAKMNAAEKARAAGPFPQVFGIGLRAVPKNAQTKVYFMGCERFVKIGMAADPRRRMQDHQISVPFKLKMLAIIEGGMEEENKLHAQFKHLHERGEWFRLEGDLADYIASLEPADAEELAHRKRGRQPKKRDM